MEEQLIKKQTRRLFFGYLLTFALLFTLLGVVVFQAINRNMYKEVDRNLTSAAQSQRTIEREVKFLKDEPKTTPPSNNTTPPNDENLNFDDGDFRSDLQQVVLLWSKKGELLNEEALGVRFTEYSQVTLTTTVLDKITSLSYEDSQGVQHTFHQITVAASSADLTELAYVQVLVNTDQIKTSMKRFQVTLLLAMGVAFIVALIASYLLAQRALKPIVSGWEKQQAFVANASHELRTPLAVMQSQLEGLFLSPEKQVIEVSEPIATTLREIRRLTKLSNDLLLLARFDAQQSVSDKKLTAVPHFLQEISEPYSELAQGEGKTLLLDNTVTESLLFDPDQIRQLLLILLDNALKYTTAGDTITILSKVQEKNWLLQVKDTGGGFQTVSPQQLFDRFYREDTARTTKGSGLGLAIAKTIVTSHDGEIKAEKNLPHGAIFSVTLPRKK